MVSEVERIRTEYADRERRLPTDLYALTHPFNLFALQQKNRLMLRQLNRRGLAQLEGRRILDVGCGDGHHLLEFLAWGATRSELAGIDLLERRVQRAWARLGDPADAGSPDLRVGDATRLPWPDASFDIVHQGTVFTSMLDSSMKQAVAREMVRVLKPNGVIIWYDLRVNNPNNQAVRGIGRREIGALFQGSRVELRRVTLAPPIGRRTVPVSWIGSMLLEKLVVLNTHYLGFISKA